MKRVDPSMKIILDQSLMLMLAQQKVKGQMHQMPQVQMGIVMLIPSRVMIATVAVVLMKILMIFSVEVMMMKTCRFPIQE